MDSHTKDVRARDSNLYFLIQKYLQNQYMQYIKLHRLYDKLAILVRYTGFSVKNKTNQYQRTDAGRRLHTHR